MPRIEVVVEGLALWIDRGTYWNVLFPVCKESPKRTHHPRLSISIGGWDLGSSVPLDERILDLIHLVPGYTGKMRADWMLPTIRGTVNKAKVPVPDVGSANVLAALRLPKRVLSPASRRQVGPVHFAGKTDHHLDFATLWQAEIFSSQALVVMRDRTTRREVETIPVDGYGNTIRLTIRNRTAAEHDKPGKPTKKGEKLKEFNDILTLTKSPQGIPEYHGDDLDDGTASEGRVLAIPEADPFRLCPQGFCDDCPDD